MGIDKVGIDEVGRYHLGMGLIILLDHCNGIFPELKQVLKNVCRKWMHCSFLIYSTLILSCPGDFLVLR